MVRSLVLEVSLACSSSSENTPFSSGSRNRSLAPVCLATICQGRRLLWCSITDRTISSPSWRLPSPQLYATRLRDSVVFLVKMISSGLAAPRKEATFARALS